MGAFIANCDRLRSETGGHVAIIHHDGKDGTKGARGHSSLYGAVDTQVRISKSAAGNIATVTKQKDDEDGAVFGFRLEKVILGEDEDGEPITSCIIGPSETKPGGNSISLSDAQQIALNQLIKAIGHEGKVPPASNHIPPHKPCVTEKTWRTYCVSGGISSSDNKDSNRKAFKRSADRLVAIELVEAKSTERFDLIDGALLLGGFARLLVEPVDGSATQWSDEVWVISGTTVDLMIGRDGVLISSRPSGPDDDCWQFDQVCAVN